MSTEISEKESVNSTANGAGQVTKETKKGVDTADYTTVKMADDAKTLLVGNLMVWEDSFATWQEYHQAYTNFVLQSMQQVLNDALVFRESLGKIMNDNFKKAHVVSEQERQMVLDSARLIQEQARATSEQTGKMMTTASKMMTTMMLFNDWAIERAAKVFTTGLIT